MMANTSTRSVCLILLCGWLPAQETPEPDLRFKVSANLVQVDAMVTAPPGQTVPPLTADDFEILEDGKPQRASMFAAAEHRTVVFLVDRCTTILLEAEPALSSFLSNIGMDVRPGDKVAILNGSDGSAQVQQYTDNMLVLREQAGLVRIPTRLMVWCMDHTRRPSPIEYPIAVSALEAPPLTTRLKYSQAGVEDRRIVVAGESGWLSILMEAVSLGIDYLRKEPGHKDLVLFSANLTDSSRAKRAVDELTDRANRYGVTVHVIFPGEKRLPPPQPVLDPESRTSSNDLGYQTLLRTYNDASFRLSMLGRIAADTGGVFFQRPSSQPPPRDPRKRLSVEERMNVITEEEKQGLARHLEQSWRSILRDFGVYTLGYRPEAVTDGYHKLTVRVRRPGLTVRARNGYYDTPPKAAPVVEAGPPRLTDVLEAPLLGTELRLSAQGFDIARQKPGGKLETVVRLVVSIDPRDLSWEDRGGRKRGSVELAAVAYGFEHQVASKAAQDCAVEDRAGSGAASAQCQMELPFKAPGLYMVRVAVRDRASGKTGFAHTVVAASDHAVKRLSLSDPVLLRMPVRSHAFSDEVFAPGDTMAYELSAYGFMPDKKSKQPKLAIRVGITSVSTGRPVFVGDETPVAADGATWQAPLKGKLTLPKDFAPGEYMIEFVVGDKPGKAVLNRIAAFQVATPQ